MIIVSDGPKIVNIGWMGATYTDGCHELGARADILAFFSIPVLDQIYPTPTTRRPQTAILNNGSRHHFRLPLANLA